MKRLMTAMIVAGLLGCPVTSAQAEGVGINTTRIIYPADSRATTASVSNTSKEAVYLIQATVSSTSAGDKTAPFLVTPPLFRMEPNSQNQVRIIKTGPTLPADRESLFWFTAKAIPLSSESDNRSQRNVSGGIQFAIANTIKLMYRPSGLSVSPEQGFGSLRFKPAAAGITVTNPSPYYITLTSLNVGGQEVMMQQKANMVSPFSDLSLLLKGGRYPAKVSWTVINDFGGESTYQGEIP
ncbi:fimbria/pilus periplasmic chaperone [Photorhabdus bodei]|uniref:Fimbria/pilus periplasmic chaperone n=1 Tax=Photorhabdus bodei TaxID=2029681 RepID=A0ABX0ARZ8_9GAMM|nr:fimbria/pilus periplasmic chaperone [Photorhabdus bodei]NDL04492.1 fimbria/pilus periplasmic chaperone [Photorhabdus bodei]NDL08863.1 fimbria/pilus periplasmic chaperone [Photorhabdus bodei]